MILPSYFLYLDWEKLWVAANRSMKQRNIQANALNDDSLKIWGLGDGNN